MRFQCVSPCNCIIFITSLFLVLQITTTNENMDQRVVTAALTKFAGHFLKELDAESNVVASPLSAEILLALLTLGATGKAREELLARLELPDDDSIRSAFTHVTSKLKSVKGVTLDVANKVYIMEGPHELQADLKNDAIKVFDCAFEKLNFANSGDAANKINTWVESKTNNRIKDLISSDSLDECTRLVLVNAIYFKGTWKNQFDPHFTRDLPFHVDEKTTVDVPMMYRETNFKYYESEELQAQLLEMPYEGGEASMLIILPRDVTGLPSVIKHIQSGYDIQKDMDSMVSTKVQVTIPKFKIETTIDLKDLLRKLDIGQIFSEFESGLTNVLEGNEKLYVSQAVQKAFIEVNEEGAEAAAASAMAAACYSALIDFTPVPQLLADHPFLVGILDENRTPFFVAAYRGADSN